MEERYWILLNKHAANDLTPAERKELQSWAGNDLERNALINDFREIRNAGEDVKAPNVDTDAGWAKMQERITEKPAPVGEKITSGQLFVRIAIIVAIAAAVIISFALFSKPQTITVTTKTLEQKDVILPDGSQVHLSENSALAYQTSFKGANHRKVALKGEAFFEVTEDPKHPFVLETGFTQTTVLGASFNVLQKQNGTVSVEVVTGKVVFNEKGNGKNSLTLLPEDAGTLAKNSKPVLSKVSNTNFMFFKNQQLNFVDTPLAEVLQTLEKAYNVKFNVKDTAIMQERITAAFNRQHMAEVKQTLQALSNIRISVSGSDYLIHR